MRRTVGTLCAALAVAALAPSAALAQANAPAPAPAYYQQPYQARDSWYIGFGLGSGAGGLTVNGQSQSFHDFLSGYDPISVALQFEVGATLRPDLLFGFDLRALRSQGSANGVDAGVQATDYLAMLTWFPQQRGLFLRGGAGLATITADMNVNGSRSSDTVGGVALLGGVGYAFWLGQRFNLTLNLDASAQFYADSTDRPTSSRFVDAYLGFTWY